MQAAHADEMPWNRLIDEFKSLRASTISLFESLPSEAWTRSGFASDSPVSVRALAYIIAGHVAHHTKVLKEKYRL